MDILLLIGAGVLVFLAIELYLWYVYFVGGWSEAIRHSRAAWLWRRLRRYL